ncbi:MAG: sensor histidine kinase [Thiotrichales bacterium]|nr:sensor histidine kinase [Thiotrichales bacterium]
MSSIRTFLILSIVATLVLFNFIAAIQGYSSSMKEAELLFDEKMLNTAKLIANLHVEGNASNIEHTSTIAFQLWKDNKIIAASNNAPDTPIADFQPGYGYINFDRHRWRSLGYYDRKRNVWIALAERDDIRFLLAENVILKSVYPILLGIPLVSLLIWLIIGYGLKPLRQLANELSNKKNNDLTPIAAKESTKELKQVTTSINSLLQRLDATLEREKLFTADAAHELRTPISALKIQLHNIKQEIPANSDALKQLNDGVNRMHHLIEQLLLLYRTTPEELTKDFSEIDLYTLTQNIIAEHYSDFEKKQQNIELIGIHNKINGNTFGLTALIQNLLNNANKYTPKGGDIRISLEETESKYSLRVEDSGPGIPIEARNQVFERFYRHKNQQAIPGCGLGLTIVKHIADLHGATIKIENSSFPSGCAITIEFGRQ